MLAECYAIQGKILQKKGELQDAESDFRTAIGLFENLRVRKSHFWIQSLTSLADILSAQGRINEAEGYYRRALAISLRHMPDLTYVSDHIIRQLTLLAERKSKSLNLSDENKIVTELEPLAKLRLMMDQKNGCLTLVLVMLLKRFSYLKG